MNKQKIITTKQLISTGILNDFFNHIKKSPKRKYWINYYTRKIVEDMNYIYKDKDFIDPALKYLQSLRKDCTKLSKIETHNYLFEPMRRFLEIEFKVGKEYIKRFRQKDKKDLRIYLFLMHLNKILRRVKEEKRYEIMADLCLVINNPPSKSKFKNWKNEHSYYDDKEFTRIKKRLQRIPHYFDVEFKNKKYKRYEKYQNKSLKEAIKINKKSGQKTNPLWKKEISRKKYIRNQYLERHIEKLLERYEKHLNGLNILELDNILKKLRIKNIHQVFNELIDDNDFLNAFQIPNPKS